MVEIKDEDETEEPQPASPFADAIQSLTMSTDSLVDGMPLSLATLENSAKAARKRMMDFLKPFVTSTTRHEERKTQTFTASLPDDKAWQLEQLKLRLIRREHGLRVVSESFLVTLMTQYDSYIGALARCVMIQHPEILNGSERALTFTQLQSFQNLDDARSHIMDREIDELLRGGHSKQIDWFEKRLGQKKADLVSKLGPWSEFIEATERRNVIVHANAEVTRQYLEECEKAKYPLGSGLKVGDRVEITPKYFLGAYEATVEVGLRLGVAMWLNMTSGQGWTVVNFLNDLTLNYLGEEKFRLAARLCDFAFELANKYCDAATRRIAVLNLAQAYKWASDEAAMREALNREDWSSCDYVSKLALSILRDEPEEVDRYMRILHKIDEFPSENYRRWPIFRQARKDKTFQATYLELYGEPLADELAAVASVLHDARLVVLRPTVSAAGELTGLEQDAATTPQSTTNEIVAEMSPSSTPSLDDTENPGNPKIAQEGNS